MSESRKGTKENQGERSKNAVKVKSHYCTHIGQLKPKITFKRTKANASETLSKSQRKHRENAL